MTKNKFYSCIIASILLISGCAERVTVNPDSNLIQENLLARCTADTPELQSTKTDSTGKAVYDGTDVVNVLKEWQRVYDQCSFKDDKLVESVRKLQEQSTIKVK